MINLKRILLPTDFSKLSEHATKYACAFAEQFDAELHVLHVFEPPVPAVFSPGTTMSIAGGYMSELEKDGANAMKKVLDPNWVKDKKVVRATAQGNPFLEIVRYAKDRDIDLIVMGTHGRSALPHLLIGSVAEKVVRKAPCPVLTVRPSGQEFVMP